MKMTLALCSLALFPLCGFAENEIGKFDPLMAEQKATVDTNGVKWIDGRYLPLEGRAFDDTEHYYDRLPANVTTNVNAGVRNMKHHTSGMLFRFSTDSKRLRFKWTPYNPGLAMDHMPSTGVSGIDVYRYDADAKRWKYVKTGRIWSAEGGYLDIPWTPNTPCLVNLPLYNGIRSFTLGIDRDATVKALPPRLSGVTKPVVFYGTSITHGGCCSRPGMGFVNILGRTCDVPVVNLGFSGSGHMEFEMSEHLARIDASCYVLDCLWNMGSLAAGNKPGATVEENFEPFVRNLRAKRPDVPIVIAESCDVYFGEAPRSSHHQAKDRFVRGVYDKLIAEGWKHLYWLPKDEMFSGDFEGTVDGSHPNDAGMQTLASAFGKAVLAALAGTVKTPGVTWIDGRDLPSEGRPFPDSPTYARLPSRFAGVLPQRDMVLGTNTAGRVFRFVTDAKKLRFHWSLAFPESKDMHHMSMTGVSGIDVYRRTGDGPWFAHTARRRLLPLWTPKYDGSYRYEMDWTPGDECLLYLPCYNGIATFELGIDDGVKILPGPAHRGAKKPVVLFGHSITQGGCASRGGLIWPAVVGRRLDVEIVNLGLSGSAFMEIEWARALGELDPAVFVIDTADNQTLERARTRYEPFLRELKRLRPDVPMLVLENTDVHDRAGKAKVEDIIRGIIEKLKKEDPKTWANLHLLRHAEYQMDDEGTVDGIHLNDLGMMKVADAVERRLRPLLGRPYVAYDFTRERLFPGFDGKYCKICPSIKTDGKGLAFLAYQHLLLTGSDVTYGQFMAKSTDGGKTWSEPKKVTALADTYERGLRATYAGSPVYSVKTGRWFGLGFKEYFKDDKDPFQEYVDGHPFQVPLYLDFDPEKGELTGYRELPFPFDSEGGFPFGQRVEEENGDFTIPFYFKPHGLPGAKTRVVTVRYRQAESNLVVVAAGTPVGRDDLRRGLGEPSLAKLGTKYYLTFRSDESGFVSESEDGLTFSVPRPWTWDGKTSIGNRNTQQHWVKLGDALFLAYTREGAANDHVFRNRAPIFLAQFDPVRLCLLKETERTLVPELGTRLGNFSVTFAGDEQWLTTAEWMQPRGCERYGSDNSIWFVRLKVR